MYFAHMVGIQQLTLVQFRNYIQKEFHFTNRIVGIVGPNGVGKTNVLDALYYLSFTKSYFSRPDAQNVHHAYQGLRIDGKYNINNNDVTISCIIRENLKKEFYFDEEMYPKHSQHLGKIPCVMIAPDDVQIITGASEERRKLMDSLLCQIHPPYLKYLIQYNKILLQRNSLLKIANETGNLDALLLETLNEQLIASGNPIHEYRNQLMQEWLPEVLNLYQHLAGQADGISIKYQSTLSDQNFKSLLVQSLAKDTLLHRTNVGIHKDDLVVTIQNQPFKQEASQGQRKSLLFAIRLAEWMILKKYKGFSPILLMDDIFEKLDENRMVQLLAWVSKSTDGQVFITDTHKDRLTQLLGKHLSSYQLIEI
ncbi:MAG: DNA replication and repair protein RecF [Sediminibacterium sp.]|nr:DNA replication and repair protein RecF [Sediminibacterium sp.]